MTMGRLDSRRSAVKQQMASKHTTYYKLGECDSSSVFNEPGQICPGTQCHSPSVRVCVLVAVGVDNNFDNLGHNFQTRSDRDFILYMGIPCDVTFPMVP